MKKRSFYRNNKKDKSSIVNLIKDFIYWTKTLSIIKYIFFFYLFITLVGSLLLFMPISQNKNSVSYVNALFVAASAFSDTGLNPLITGADFSYFGQTIIAVLIFIGGTGWIALKIYFFNILFDIPMSLKTRTALAQERGSTKIGSTTNLIKVSVTAMMVIATTAAVILSFYFYYVPGNFGDPKSYLPNPSDRHNGV
jgi:Trk-type K+ transport system membrane component